MEQTKLIRWLAMLQGIYFFVTGVWPILHIESFIWISGPKYDIWLVEAVGILIAIIGLTMFSAGYHKRVNLETALISAGSAAGLATIDIYYALIDRIWDVYLLDALAEIIFILLWLILTYRTNRLKTKRSS